MLHKHNIFEVCREASALLGNTKGNNGRALRRFLSRMAPDGIISQVLVMSPGWSPVQLDAIEQYAVRLAIEVEHYLPSPAEGWSFIGTCRDDMFDVIQNSYKLSYPISTASVRQLRAMVILVAVLADTMQSFAYQPNKDALLFCPDYEYRNLSHTISETKWLVQGKDMRGGSGVLEWCSDECDAQQRLAMMQPHQRFANLNAIAWQEGQGHCTTYA
ncbi:MAG: hypothetical protein Q7S87_10415 [Agitococcus sp.]|nr:hypothetical protein [Agitococcus sp.]